MSYNVKLQKGSKGNNVKLLKTYLNVLVQPKPNLKEDQIFDQATHEAVIKFEMQQGFDKVDGVVDANTWAAIGKRLGFRIWRMRHVPAPPHWLLNLAMQGPLIDASLNIDRSGFFSMYMEEYGPLDQTQLDGLDRLLEFIHRDPEVKDVRWAAYMLATVKHECANTWQPIKERGQGAGRSYGKPVTVTGSDGKKYTHVYYGRGYVQLTWWDKYKKLGKALGLGDELLIRPDGALEPATAYKIMSIGMRDGMFLTAGYKLSDYINGRTTDYFNARNIINTNHDSAGLIKGYAERLEAMLKANLKSGASAALWIPIY